MPERGLCLLFCGDDDDPQIGSQISNTHPSQIPNTLSQKYYPKYQTYNTKNLFNASQFGNLRQNKFAILYKKNLQLKTIIILKY